MITVSQTKELLAIFSFAYRSAFQTLEGADTEFMAKLWQRKLMPYDWEEVQQALDFITSTKKFMPSMAEFIEVLENNRNPELQVTALEAWGHVLEAIRHYGYYNFGGAKEHLTERELKAVKQIGWSNLCTSGGYEMACLERDFKEIYNQDKSNEMKLLINNHNQNIKSIENKTKQIEGGGA